MLASSTRCVFVSSHLLFKLSSSPTYCTSLKCAEFQGPDRGCLPIDIAHRFNTLPATFQGSAIRTQNVPIVNGRRDKNCCKQLVLTGTAGNSLGMMKLCCEMKTSYEQHSDTTKEQLTHWPDLD
ncbi:hypothetical protein PGT21_022201 [Puccinia graminis f. sp. tritici]|uniref:Uncharacterized protein n=1 Tax=Puccinia graminis f. sp. tritici TaxID=56615 RepID=A0A5B0MHJ1_PUCGR|nr:hypothetical protein PGT21_022201 [Puccinia graminis f. sp. tritici]KAA1075491.1 hypothetical protein PGTUg99_015905 [Puccinia graminis f. sp. tritici]KAA1075494.1 hypothetical protein PGTUg99_016366 [Puccinia graminis f. sp. tritici]